MYLSFNSTEPVYSSVYMPAIKGGSKNYVGLIFVLFFLCFCKLKKEHSGLCDRWDLTKWHRKGRKAAETENTRKGKNLNSEFLEPPLCLRNTKKAEKFFNSLRFCTQTRDRTGMGCPTGVWDQRVYRFRHLGFLRCKGRCFCWIDQMF